MNKHLVPSSTRKAGIANFCAFILERQTIPTEVILQSYESHKSVFFFTGKAFVKGDVICPFSQVDMMQ